MKLKDCVPGTNVVVYDRNFLGKNGVISSHNSAGQTLINVVLAEIGESCYFHHKQLRKVVKVKKNKNAPIRYVTIGRFPEYSFERDNGYLKIEDFKKAGYDVWLMRGVKKL